MSQNRIKEILSCPIYSSYKKARSHDERAKLVWDYVSECCFCHPNRFYCDEFISSYNTYQKENDKNYEDATNVIQGCIIRHKLLKAKKDELILLYPIYTKFPSGECLHCLVKYPSISFRCDSYISMARAFWDSMPENEIQLVKLLTKHTQRPPLPGLRFMNLDEVVGLGQKELSLPKAEVLNLVEKLLKRDVLEKSTDGIRIKV